MIVADGKVCSILMTQSVFTGGHIKARAGGGDRLTGENSTNGSDCPGKRLEGAFKDNS